MMTRKLRNFMGLSQVGRAAIIALAAFSVALPTAAQVTQVSDSGIDQSTETNPTAGTGGDYRLGGYGECFSVVPQADPRFTGPEVEVGPDFYNDTLDTVEAGIVSTQYDNLCTLEMIQRTDEYFDTGTWGTIATESGCYDKWEADATGNTGLTDPDRTASQQDFVDRPVLIPNPDRVLDSAVCITESGIPTTSPFFDFSLYSSRTDGPGPVANAWSFFEANNNGDDEISEVMEHISGYDPPGNAPTTASQSQSKPSQYNACAIDPVTLEPFRAATFDAEIDDWDPLSGVVYLGDENGGDALVAYYFLTAALRNGKQVQDWVLYIDEGTGEIELASSADDPGPGQVSEFAQGKYLWFELVGIPKGSTLRLAVQEYDPGSVNGNSHLSGIFITGTDICGTRPDLSCSLVDFTKTVSNADPSVGDTVTWTYRVTNGTDIDFNSFQIRDDNGTPDDENDYFLVDCEGAIQSGASVTCTATGTVEELGLYTNTAAFSATTASGGTVTGPPACTASSSYFALPGDEPPPPTDPGTGTQGYWKNHDWPVEGISIGDTWYDKDDAIGYMNAKGKRGVEYNMFNQLVAAKLNVEIGNDDRCVAVIIAEADAWMRLYPVDDNDSVKANSDAWQEPEGDNLSSASDLHDTLDAYNNGDLYDQNGVICATHRD